MPDLDFQVQEAVSVPDAASPHLAFKLGIAVRDGADAAISAIALRCQIRIEPTRRPYNGTEAERLLDLFGERERWGTTLKGLLWTHVSMIVPSFTGSTVVDLPVPCSFDFNVAATKYFAALDGGEIPLCLFFSGSVFHSDDDGALQVSPISWEKEARFRLPVTVWRSMMDLYYPNSAWLCLQNDVFRRLLQYKMNRGLPTWEQALERLLEKADSVVTP